MSVPHEPPRETFSTDLPRFRAAVRLSGGNLTRAAATLGISKTYAMQLAARFGLRQWARGLRLKSGAPPTGRPPKDAA